MKHCGGSRINSRMTGCAWHDRALAVGSKWKGRSVGLESIGREELERFLSHDFHGAELKRVFVDCSCTDGIARQKRRLSKLRVSRLKAAQDHERNSPCIAEGSQLHSDGYWTSLAIAALIKSSESAS